MPIALDEKATLLLYQQGYRILPALTCPVLVKIRVSTARFFFHDEEGIFRENISER
jgi:hypothetical protein